jgi:hypothetical protein
MNNKLDPITVSEVCTSYNQLFQSTDFIRSLSIILDKVNAYDKEKII